MSNNLFYVLADAETIQKICSDNSEMVAIWNFISAILTVIQIAVPILLIIMGSLDLAKAVMAGKDDEIKKAQGTFVKRAIAAVIVFFVPVVVKLVLGLVPVGTGDAKTTFKTCIDKLK